MTLYRIAIAAHLIFIAIWAYLLAHGAPQGMGGVMIGFSIVCGGVATKGLRGKRG